MFLLDDILLAPIKGMMWLSEKIKDHVESNLYNPEAIKASMRALEATFERGEISKSEFEESEAKLLDALQEAYAYQKQKGTQA